MTRIPREPAGRAALPAPRPLGTAVLEIAPRGRAPFRVSRLRTVQAGAGLLATGALLLGCGAPAPASLSTTPPTSFDAPPSALPPSSGASAAPSTPDATEAPAEPVRLPWPAATTAEAAQLQSSVDRGSEPWLLDPAEVALSYATAAHGWTGAEAQPHPDGTTVEVQDGRRKLVLTLDQPARAGAGGIWVVTAEMGG
jgi:hypothetical protein